MGFEDLYEKYTLKPEPEVKVRGLRSTSYQDDWDERFGYADEPGRYEHGKGEAELLRALRRIRVLGEPDRDYEIIRNGRLLTVPDFTWEFEMVAVYVDGGVHFPEDAVKSDMWRRSYMTSWGWAVLVYSTDSAKNYAERTATEIARVVRARRRMTYEWLANHANHVTS